MPELPGSRNDPNGYRTPYSGSASCKGDVRNPRLRWPVPDHLEDQLRGKVIAAVKRRAKYLLLEIEDGTLIIHLGMSGNLRIVKVGEPVKQHDHVDVVLRNGSCLRYHDPRRFGAVLWSDQPVYEHELLKKLGPEPLSDDFTPQLLYRSSRNKTQAVKTFIMDSHVVAGVGNIYANEALFKSGIRPDRPAGKISTKRYGQLTEHIKVTLAEANSTGWDNITGFCWRRRQAGVFQNNV